MLVFGGVSQSWSTLVKFSDNKMVKKRPSMSVSSSKKRTWLAAKWTWIEDGDFPASHVSLLECTGCFFVPVFCGVFLFRTSIPKDSQLSSSRSCTEQRSRVLKMAVSSPAVLRVIRRQGMEGQQSQAPRLYIHISFVAPTPTAKPSNLEFGNMLPKQNAPPNRIYVGKKNPWALTTKKPGGPLG